MSNKDFKVKNGLVIPALSTAGIVKTDSSGVISSSATLSISEGGTGQTTAGNALNALLPLQTNNTNYYLQTNGTTTQWNQVLSTAYQTSEPTSPVTGQVWIDSDSTDVAFDTNIIRRQAFTATAAQTVFTTDVSFIDGYEQVFFNGMLLLRTSDYTTSNSNTITLASGAAVNDIVEVVTVTNLNSVNTYTQAEINSAILVAVPSQTGNSGKYLTTNGTISSWATIDLSSYLTSSTAASTYATITRVNDIEIANIMGAY
jgi:hypothetical protein